MDTATESSLHLVDEHGEIFGSFSVDALMLESLRGYLQACAQTAYYAQLQSSLAASMKAALQGVLPYHLRQPSEAQINYAVGIARALSVPVPPEALSQRWAMHEFLDTHVPAFKAKQASKLSGTQGSGSATSANEAKRAEDSERGGSPSGQEEYPHAYE